MSTSTESVTPRKRKRSSSPAASATVAPPKHIPASIKDGEEYTWPAPASALKDAERFIYQCATAGEKVLLVPDKDADGLSAGVILYRTLRALGLDESLLQVHLMSKGNHPGAPAERAAMQNYGARYIVVLDQGSREGPALVDGAEHGWDWEKEHDASDLRGQCSSSRSASPPRVHTMVLDHHFLSNPLRGGPRGALLVNASHSEPVATTALLTWHICRPLLTRPARQGGVGLSDEEAGNLIDWLCLIGTMGDLGISVKWDPPFPDMKAQIKRWSKKKLGTAIALLNAPRRTPAFDTITAWRVLLHSDSPATIADGLAPATSTGAPSSSSSSSKPALPSTFPQDLARLFAAREAVAAETERCTHTPPKFSRDGRIALLRIRSAFQVHPGIATRWSGTLRGAKKLQAVMCANDGYSGEAGAADQEGGNGGLDGKRTGALTHFSCRIAQAAKARGEDPNLIELLHDYAARDPAFLSDLKAATEDSSFEDVEPEPHGNGEPARVSVGNFARGHRQASGGIIPHDFFERFVALMEIGVAPEPGSAGSSPKKSKKGAGPAQKNVLTNYFKKA
ncbi:hypothetical protein OC834_006691 [Tilletia horrida]|nr:hypothetical protein OC834_006691 [Tilletia horrida]KAK0528662.1 hypothetical protein OC835_004583 [Tilletia horrida]